MNQKTSEKTLPVSKISCVVPRSADVLACQEKCNLFLTENCRIVLAGEWKGGRIETKGKLTGRQIRHRKDQLFIIMACLREKEGRQTAVRLKGTVA